MSVAEATSRATEQRVSAKRGAMFVSGLPLLLVLLGALPLVMVHVIQQMARPHYQFILVLPVAIVALAWSRLKEGVELGPARSIPLATLGAISFALLALATYLWSPWLGMLSWLVAALAVIYRVGGWSLSRPLLPAWLVSSLVLPPPLGLDELLIVELRDVTTLWASSILDQFGIFHLVSGNVIELPEKSLFVADACSGIHSLFVLVAMALFLSLWMRRSIVHVAMLVAMTLVIVMVENVARVVLIAAAANWQFDLSEGIPHQILGLSLFILSLLWIMSADRLLLAIIPRWQWKRARKTQTVTLGPARSTRPVLAVTWCLGLIAIVLAVLQVSSPNLNAERVAQLLEYNSFDFPKFEAGSLPESWDGWERGEYTFEQRGAGNPLAEFSQQWVYQKQGQRVIVSLDYPYPEFHDLGQCYRRIGWTVVQAGVLDEDLAPSQTLAGQTAHLHLHKDLYGEAYVFFTAYDHEGQARAATANNQTPAYLVATRFHLDPDPCYQIQLFAPAALELTAAQRQELLELFVHCRDQLQEQCQTHTD